jgi:hypothetical protein
MVWSVATERRCSDGSVYLYFDSAISEDLSSANPDTVLPTLTLLRDHVLVYCAAEVVELEATRIEHGSNPRCVD